MSEHEWVHLTAEQLDADPALAAAVGRFIAPASGAGDAAARWLKERALGEIEHVATYVLVIEGEVAAFHSLGMSEVELRTQHRKKLAAAHPQQGAVLILWLARAADAEVDAETILRHAVGIGQIAARRVGAAVIALDPFDAATEQFWRERFGFRASLTRRRRWGAAAAMAAALPLRLGVLPNARPAPGGLGDILLGVQAELAPALIEACLGKLVGIDDRGRVDWVLGAE